MPDNNKLKNNNKNYRTCNKYFGEEVSFCLARMKIFTYIKHYKGNCRGSLIIKHLFTSEKEFDVHENEATTTTENEREIFSQQQEIKK